MPARNSGLSLEKGPRSDLLRGPFRRLPVQLGHQEPLRRASSRRPTVRPFLPPKHLIPQTASTVAPESSQSQSCGRAGPWGPYSPFQQSSSIGGQAASSGAKRTRPSRPRRENNCFSQSYVPNQAPHSRKPSAPASK